MPAAPAEPEQEKPLARVVRLWTAHAAAIEELKAADRLTVASAYRSWAKTAELGLKEGEAVPSFTEVWIELTNRKRKAAPAEGPKEADPEAKRESKVARKDKEGGPAYSEKEALNVLCTALHSIKKERGTRDPVQASFVNSAIRRVRSDFHISRTPFERLLNMLKHAEQEGWLYIDKRRDDVRVTIRSLPALPEGEAVRSVTMRDTPVTVGADAARKHLGAGKEAAKAGEKAEAAEPPPYVVLLQEWQGRHTGEEPPCYALLLTDWSRLRQEGQIEKVANPMDEFYGSSSYVNTKGGEAAKKADDDKAREEPERRARSRSAPRRGAGRGDPAIDKRECLRMFDVALKEVCDEGFYGGLPVNSSEFDQRNTPFERFTDLLEEAARDGLVKFTRRRSGLPHNHTDKWGFVPFPFVPSLFHQAGLT
ncbi:unnamed protein product [Prorocentrum cordatum]|uniref:Uncharacterized protein n=1 Tax=Prorocentrum cordatum TaxID=2364126 RepID=A0ABN9XRC1_9DINO|nr:unnamed protein product [Polarella glacialis]